MSNELMFVMDVVLFLFATVAMYKLFGLSGLYAFTVFGVILANIQVSKNIMLFGLETTAGNVLYASTFLATDIIEEHYGHKQALKAVRIGIVTTVLWVIGTQLTLHLTPSASDFVQGPMEGLFGIVPRICLGSLIAYVVSQFTDTFLYRFWWSVTKTSENPNRMKWLRNNGSTLISQFLDTIIFVTISFYGVYDSKVFFSILWTTYLFKAIVALCDTPFLYLAGKIKPMED